MADKYKRGFYVQEDFWLAVEDCSAKAQNEVMGALARLFFTGEDSAETLRGVSKSVYIALRERVAGSRTKSVARGGEFSGNQTGNQTGNQNANLLLKSKSESEISTCDSPKLEPLPTRREPSARAVFIGRAMEVFTEVTGRPALIPSSEVTFGLTKIFDAGYTVEDVRLVCQAKNAEWGGDAKCQRWIRPQTLFGDKFESYLAAAKADPAKEARDAAAEFADAI